VRKNLRVLYRGRGEKIMSAENKQDQPAALPKSTQMVNREEAMTEFTEAEKAVIRRYFEQLQKVSKKKHLIRISEYQTAHKEELKEIKRELRKNMPKKPLGRPRKIKVEEPAEDKPKKPLGRPRKIKKEPTEEPIEDKPKKALARPRKIRKDPLVHKPSAIEQKEGSD